MNGRKIDKDYGRQTEIDTNRDREANGKRYRQHQREIDREKHRQRARQTREVSFLVICWYLISPSEPPFWQLWVSMHT